MANLERLIQQIERKSSVFMTYRVRGFARDFGGRETLNLIGNTNFSSRQMNETFGVRGLSNKSYLSTAIIIQGPVDRRNDFTLRAAKHYLETFPGIKVILSTWENESTKEFRDLSRNANFFILQNKSPKKPGISNINLQIVSTLKAIEFAEGLGAEFLLKTRSDQCILNSSAIEVLLFFADKWPNRIIVTSRNSFTFRLYGLSDMFQFGKTKDIKDYWSAPCDDREPSEIDFVENMTLLDYSKLNIVETYLGSSYLERIGTKPLFTFKQSLEMVRDNFFVLDDTHLDLVWNKYSRNETPWKLLRGQNAFREFTQTDWERMQESLGFLLASESFMSENHLI